jgi:hypothetical protein
MNSAAAATAKLKLAIIEDTFEVFALSSAAIADLSEICSAYRNRLRINTSSAIFITSVSLRPWQSIWPAGLQ